MICVSRVCLLHHQAYVLLPHLFAALTFCVVTLITGLILCGLIIDLGGGPDHKRLGFKVSKSLEFSFNVLILMLSTGNIPVPSMALVSLKASPQITS